MGKNVILINGGIMIIVILSIKNVIVCAKDYIWNPSKCSCENGKYLVNVMDNSTIMFDEVIDSYDKETKLFLLILMKKNPSLKRKIPIFYLPFY